MTYICQYRGGGVGGREEMIHQYPVLPFPVACIKLSNSAKGWGK